LLTTARVPEIIGEGASLSGCEYHQVYQTTIGVRELKQCAALQSLDVIKGDEVRVHTLVWQTVVKLIYVLVDPIRFSLTPGNYPLDQLSPTGLRSCPAPSAVFHNTEASASTTRREQAAELADGAT
jgi:hypothetical protein